MTRLVIARHGNTFDVGDTVLRVGARTDLSLSSSGCEQARRLGAYLNEKNFIFDSCYVSELKRTQETARIALGAMGLKLVPEVNRSFNEIDYGIDDGKPEEEVVQRIGIDALLDWEESMVVPSGWHFNVDSAIKAWQDFADTCLQRHSNKTILIVTSNGIARFAGVLADALSLIKETYGFKLKTGAFGIIEHNGKAWKIQDWNVKP